MTDRQIKYVELAGNTSFKPPEAGGYGNQRTSFEASKVCRLSVDEDGIGVLVELAPNGGNPGQVFTLCWPLIRYVEWAVPPAKGKGKALDKDPPPPAA
jgi:hypothetical protein